MKLRKLASVLTICVLLVLASPSVWAQDGAALYKSNCAGCHKADGSGNQAIKAPAVKGKADAVAKTVNENAKHAPLKKKLSDEQVKAITEYVRNLK
ncbi:MAG TPA: cytochrome c [Terriglobales bacterium]|nr:cytochrome c [Terriglobales bacterium]